MSFPPGLQVHDEVILEGPIETANEALKEVEHCMGNPFDAEDGAGDEGLRSGRKNRLTVELAVDAKFAQNWRQAK